MIIYGRNVIREALAAGVLLKEASLQESRRSSSELIELETLLRAAKVPLEKTSRQRLEAVSHSPDHQGVVARIKRFGYADSVTVLDGLEHDPFVVVLDQVQDPHNVGAIIRTAAAAGADLVVLSAHGGCQITPAVLKTSAGCAFRVPISLETNLVNVLSRLKQRGAWIYGAAMEGESCFSLDLSGPLALIFGNEGDGMRRLVRENCDFLIGIPMARPLDSLNVSAAAAVISFQVRAARLASRDGRE